MLVRCSTALVAVKPAPALVDLPASIVAQQRRRRAFPVGPVPLRACADSLTEVCVSALTILTCTAPCTNSTVAAMQCAHRRYGRPLSLAAFVGVDQICPSEPTIGLWRKLTIPEATGVDTQPNQAIFDCA